MDEDRIKSILQTAFLVAGFPLEPAAGVRNAIELISQLRSSGLTWRRIALLVNGARAGYEPLSAGAIKRAWARLQATQAADRVEGQRPRQIVAGTGTAPPLSKRSDIATATDPVASHKTPLSQQRGSSRLAVARQHHAAANELDDIE